MVFKTFWGSLGLLLGALGGLLGTLGALDIDHRGLPDSSGNSLGPRSLPSGCFFLFIFVFLSSMSSFIFFRCLWASILSSQADPPTVKNLDFHQGILTCVKNSDLDPKMVLKAFGGSLGLLLGALGGLLAALWGLYIDQKGPPDSIWNSLGRHLPASCCSRWP